MPSIVSEPVVQITQQTLDLTSRQLARYLGPIASVLVKKAVLQAPSLNAFYISLADKLGTEDERHRFLKDVCAEH